MMSKFIPPLSVGKNFAVGTEPGEKKIAIVRPFIPTQTEEVVNDLLVWNEERYFPCDPNNKKKLPVDLIFYFSYDIEAHPSGPKAQKLLEQAWYFSNWKECFSGMRFLSANLNASTDKYR